MIVEGQITEYNPMTETFVMAGKSTRIEMTTDDEGLADVLFTAMKSRKTVKLVIE